MTEKTSRPDAGYIGSGGNGKHSAFAPNYTSTRIQGNTCAYPTGTTLLKTAPRHGAQPAPRDPRSLARDEKARAGTRAEGETNAGAVITVRPHHSAPRHASGNSRACLTALIAKAEARHEVETDPTRRRKLGRVVRWLTARLARVILDEQRP